MHGYRSGPLFLTSNNMKDSDQTLIELYLEGNLPKDKWDMFSTRLNESYKMRREFRKLCTLDDRLRSGSLHHLLTSEFQPKNKISLIISRTGIAACILFALFFGSKSKLLEEIGTEPLIASVPKDLQANRVPYAVILDYFQPFHNPDSILGCKIFEPRKFKMEAGGVHLRFNNCVDFIFQGPGEFEILGRKDVRIFKGNARTMVLNKKGREFTIHTDTSKIVDWGTEFSVSVSPGEKPKIKVRNGIVEIKSKDDHSLGFLERYNNPLNTTDIAKLQSSFTNFNDSKVFQPGNLGYKRKSARMNRFQSDNSVLGYFDFAYPPLSELKGNNYKEKTPQSRISVKNALRPNRIIKNHKKNSLVSNGLMHNSVWSVGRFPGSRALLMNKQESHISLDISGKHKEMTISCWINASQSMNAWSCIFGSRNWDKSGRLRFEFPRLSRTPKLFCWGEKSFGYNSQRSTDLKLPYNEWIMASIVMGISENHYLGLTYVNGDIQNKSKAKYLNYLEPGELIVGNIRNSRLSTIPDPNNWERPLSGLIDELIIWNRCLSAEEIKKLHKEGDTTYLSNFASL